MTGNDLVLWFVVQILRFVIGAAMLGAAICWVSMYYAK